MERKNIVEVKDMKKTFFGTLALDNMDFCIGEGEIRCLAGENGCGKSTMIKMISGFYRFDSGTLRINGKEYSMITPAESIREGIQVIYQDFSLFPNMTIAENIMMYETVSSRKWIVNNKKTAKRAKEVLAYIQFEVDPDKYVSELSVAEKQMVAICRAIVQDAKLLIMDEPTTALTNKEVEKLFDVIRRLKNNRVAVLFVSHKMDEVLEICDSVTIMRNGRNVFDVPAGELLPGKDELIYHMTGKQIARDEYLFEPKDNTVPLLEVRGYTRKACFEDINFKLYPGEILGITGLLGCGRGELAESLFGIEPAEEGTVLVEGTEIGIIRSIQEAISQKIAYVPEDRLSEGLHLDRSIADNSISRIISNYTDGLGILKKKELEQKRIEGFDIISVAGVHPEKPVKSLSGGNQQKVVLIKWLLSNPKILILNCPTVGVDVGAKSDIHKIIRDLAKEKGIGVIVISDDLYEIKQVCSRVFIMKDGRFSDMFKSTDKSTDEIQDLLTMDKGGTA
jgi:simple sugar transport system ATP-binding protein